jgi:hypothetical protein
LDKNLIEATDGTSLRGASYKITNDGEMIKSEDDKSDKNNTTKLEKLYSEEDQYGDDSDKECKKATRIKYFDEIIKSDIFL